MLFRLGNNDFSEEAARKASCLQPRIFKETLQAIQQVLDSHEQEKSEKQKASYDTLVAQHRFNREEFMVSCMQRTERVLVQSGKLGRNLVLPDDMITTAVFVWVCRLLKVRCRTSCHLSSSLIQLQRQSKVKEDELMEEYDIDEDEIFEVYEALDKSCRRLAKDITAEVQAMRKGQPTDSATTSPTKRSISRSPSKSILRDPSLTLVHTPSQKRKVVFASGEPEDEPMILDETPVKRPRTSPRKAKDDLDRNAFSTFQAALHTPSRPNGGLALALQASSSQLTLDLLNSAAHGDSDEEDDVTGNHTQVSEIADGALLEPISVPTTDVEMTDTTEPDEHSAVPEQSAPMTPMTPRRSDRIPRPVFKGYTQTPTTPRTTAVKASSRKESPKKAKARERREPAEEEEPPRRHRPVLLGHWQWFRPDIKAVPVGA